MLLFSNANNKKTYRLIGFLLIDGAAPIAETFLKNIALLTAIVNGIIQLFKYFTFLSLFSQQS